MPSRVVVTGGDGFLGKYVVAALKRQGCWSVLSVKHEEWDLLRKDDVHSLLKANKPDVIIHLAAIVGGIGANQDQPGKFAYENLMMGMNVLEEARLCGCPRVVLAGTVCMYPKDCPVPFKEKSIFEGYPEPTNAPYGMAKKMLFIMAEAYKKQYKMEPVCLIPVNLYGPGDEFDMRTSHVVPALFRRFWIAQHQTFHPSSYGHTGGEIWGDGTATREFLYVEDCAEAFAIAAKGYSGGDWINLGTGEEISIADLAVEIKQIVGYEGEISFDVSKPNGQPRRCLDVSRAIKQLRWVAKTPLREGLKKTWDWINATQTWQMWI